MCPEPAQSTPPKAESATPTVQLAPFPRPLSHYLHTHPVRHLTAQLRRHFSGHALDPSPWAHCRTHPVRIPLVIQDTHLTPHHGPIAACVLGAIRKLFVSKRLQTTKRTTGQKVMREAEPRKTHQATTASHRRVVRRHSAARVRSCSPLRGPGNNPAL